MKEKLPPTRRVVDTETAPLLLRLKKVELHTRGESNFAVMTNLTKLRE
jgi:hypothetical protein